MLNESLAHWILCGIWEGSEYSGLWHTPELDRYEPGDLPGDTSFTNLAGCQWKMRYELRSSVSAGTRRKSH